MPLKRTGSEIEGPVNMLLLFAVVGYTFGEFQIGQCPVPVKSPHTRDIKERCEKMSKATGHCARLGCPDV
jgi:hypothetical protein